MYDITAICHSSTSQLELRYRHHGLERAAPNATGRNILVTHMFQMCFNGPVVGGLVPTKWTAESNDLHPHLSTRATCRGSPMSISPMVLEAATLKTRGCDEWAGA